MLQFAQRPSVIDKEDLFHDTACSKYIRYYLLFVNSGIGLVIVTKNRRCGTQDKSVSSQFPKADVKGCEC